MTGKDEAKFSKLSRAECQQLLAAGTVGRIGVIVDDYPLIFPVNYAMDGETVVIRTEQGAVVANAARGKVSFQVDGLDPDTKSGWSVLMRGAGKALSVDDENELIERTRATGVIPWAPGERHLWIRIELADVTGRRITAGEGQDWRLGYPAYM